MATKKSLDIQPKIWRTILTWGLITYFVQILATVIGEVLRGFTDRYTIMSWLANLSVPAIAFLIGFVLSKWRQPQNRIQFAAIFAICTYLLCLIGQVLLSYVSDTFGPWDMLTQYIMPSVVAIALQTLISLILTARHNKRKSITSTRMYIIMLSFIALAGQVLQTAQLVPFVIRISKYTNINHTFVMPTVLVLLLIAPVVLFGTLIAVNCIKLKVIKNMSQRLFLACITSMYIFTIIETLLIFVTLFPLHDILDFWIGIASYLAALIINGIVIHHLCALSI
jgi:hypothetical protein